MVGVKIQILLKKLVQTVTRYVDPSRREVSLIGGPVSSSASWKADQRDPVEGVRRRRCGSDLLTPTQIPVGTRRGNPGIQSDGKGGGATKQMRPEVEGGSG